MERIVTHIDQMTHSLVIVLALTPFILLALPIRHQRMIALVGLSVVLGFGSFPEMGTLSSIMKVATPVAYAFVIFAFAVGQNGKVAIPAVAMIYLIMAVIVFGYVLRAGDRSHALLIMLNWFLLVVSAILVASDVKTEDDWIKASRALSWGLGIVVIAMMVDLLGDPASAFSNGRFTPYGSNPNRAGLFAVLAFAFSAYHALRQSSPATVWGYGAIAVLSIVAIALSGQRQVLFTAAMVTLPIIFTLKRHLYRFFLLPLGVVLLAWLFGFVEIFESVNIDRLKNLQTNRYERISEYLKMEIAERPLSGLLGHETKSFMKNVSLGGTHNAYIYLLYLGGFSLFLPLLICTAISVWAGVMLLINSRQGRWDPLLVAICVWLYFAILAQGLTNILIYWPTHLWAFYHILLSLLLCKLWYSRTVSFRRSALYHETKARSCNPKRP